MGYGIQLVAGGMIHPQALFVVVVVVVRCWCCCVVGGVGDVVVTVVGVGGVDH